MDKTTSVLAAFEAGKLPSTQQVNQFIDWLNDVGIAQIEPTENTELSAQGRVLANDFRGVLEAYKQLGTHKNSDNALQEAIWHLTEGDLNVTPEAEADKDQALDDLNAIRRSLRALLSIVWSSASSEGTSIVQDLLSIMRLSLADAAEVIEDKAGLAKESLRHIEDEVQEGKRDSLGRDKQRLEEEQDAKIAWQHGMDTVKNAGTTAIGAAQSGSATVEEKKEQTTTRIQDAYYKIFDRAQSDEDYRQALDTIFDIIQRRLNRTIDAASDPQVTLSSFIADPSPEQHIPKALALVRSLVERLAGTSLEPLIQCARGCANTVVRDDELKAWFDDFIGTTRKNLAEPGYARSDEAQAKRRELRVRWRTSLEKDEKWKAAVDSAKAELSKIDEGLRNDEDLNRLKASHQKLGDDIERGLVEAGKEAQTGMQAAIEQATWFWQDLFKVYIPRVLTKMRDLPIPRTEYKDSDIEFVLENLDISSFNILPSHVYIRNITDVDIQTSAKPATPSHTKVGTLTHIQIQALQLSLKDVSFWYKAKNASALEPGELTGLLGLKLPEKGIDVDLKVRLIPEHTKGPHSREALKHFNIIERAVVTISNDVGIEVRESNHALLTTLFRPVVVSRVREALERTLSETLHALVDYADGIAYDVRRRRQVFEDTGLGGGGSLMAAIWSEVGRLERESRAGPVEVDWKATGTGVVLEHRTAVGGDEFGEGAEVKTKAFAMGAEPQILSGEKRGPLGTGSEKIADKLGRAGEELGLTPEMQENIRESSMEVDIGETARDAADELGAKAKGVLKEGKKQITDFRRSVERKSQMEQSRQGWQSANFDL